MIGIKESKTGKHIILMKKVSAAQPLINKPVIKTGGILLVANEINPTIVVIVVIRIGIPTFCRVL